MSKRRTKADKIKTAQRKLLTKPVVSATPVLPAEITKRRLIIKDLVKTLLISLGMLVLLALAYWKLR